ncbi:MAG TPA: cyanophycinase [Verrucomicrobiae bacterium]|jgi:cyanophycinase|nr:cyanophycinase [Verrucomicrobiae bacterium]
MRFARVLLVSLVLFGIAAVGRAADFVYVRQGSPHDVQIHAEAGVAMMGGGTDLDEAFRWLCAKGNGGDFLIIRAHGGADYNPYIAGLCQTNSIATLIIPSRKAAQEPRVAEIIRQAEAIFIAGGDQSRYVNFWKGTPVEDAINAHVAAGKPIGGTSAGLAVLGQFVYGCLEDKPDDADLASREVLADPYIKRVTVVRDFLKVPGLENILTDSHFAKRDRMGRSLGFLARIVQDGWSKAPREIAIDEKSALLVEASGRAKVVGTGLGVYFLQVTDAPDVCKQGQPLTLRNVAAYRAPTGAKFDVQAWSGDGGEPYSISVEAGRIHTSRAGDAVY